MRAVLCSVVLAIALVPGVCRGQAVTVNQIVTDSDGQAWIGGTYSAQLVSPNGAPFFNGAPVSQAPITGSLDGTGLLNNTTFQNTSTITPTGAFYVFTITSQTSAPAVVFQAPVINTAQAGAAILAGIAPTPPRFNVGPGQYGYSDTEISTVPVVGGQYFNVIMAAVRVWTGSAFITLGGGGGGPVNATEINGVLMSGLATGTLCNTTGTGQPSICTSISISGMFETPAGQAYCINNDTGLVRNVAGTFGVSTSCTTPNLLGSFVSANITANAAIKGNLIDTLTNCTSSAAPAVCASAAAGAVVAPVATNTVTVNTTSVTANSDIHVTWNSALSTRLGVTCNTTPGTFAVSAMTPGTSFTITTSALTTNPACLTYVVIN